MQRAIVTAPRVAAAAKGTALDGPRFLS